MKTKKMKTKKCEACEGRGWVGPESLYGVGFNGPNTCKKCGGRGYCEACERRSIDKEESNEKLAEKASI